MASNEEGKASNSDTSSSPVRRDQNGVHVYPDWAAVQAYYGPRLAIPPYYNPAAASGHAPHPYIWGPQPMMAHYGAPYAAIYSPAGVYTHPSVPIVPHARGHEVSMSPSLSDPMVVMPLGTETLTKSSANTDQGLMKKLRKFDGLEMSIGNGSGVNTEHGANHGLSRSAETDGSSDGSNGNTSGENLTKRKRSCQGTPAVGEYGKGGTQACATPAGQANATFDKSVEVTISPTSVNGKLGGNVISTGMNTSLELRNPRGVNAKTHQPCLVMASEGWLQNERELKRERRKQSNRESARRSRQRKQAEAEELTVKVQTLSAENAALKSEIEHLIDNSEKLRMENGALLEKLEIAPLGQPAEAIKGKPVSTENLLSRVNNNSGTTADRSLVDEEGSVYIKNSNSTSKLHQLLDTGPITDAVAAS